MSDFHNSDRYDWSKERFAPVERKVCLCGCGKLSRASTLLKVGHGLFASDDCEKRFFFGITCDCGRKRLADEPCPTCSADAVVEGRMREARADVERDDYMERIRR